MVNIKYEYLIVKNKYKPSKIVYLIVKHYFVLHFDIVVDTQKPDTTFTKNSNLKIEMQNEKDAFIVAIGLKA